MYMNLFDYLFTCFVGISVMTAHIVVLPIIVVVEISLQLHQAFFLQLH
jgi:hypothetical protein